MIRKIIAFLIIIALVLSVGVTRVYATEEGTIVGNENGYIQDENGNDIAVNPDESDNNQNNQGPAEYVGQETIPSKDEFYANGDYNVGSEANNGTTTGPVISEDDMIVDENQIGFLAIKLEVSEDFYQNVLVELYNRKTAQIVQIPVYAANNWTENVEVPVGKYMVYNVQAGKPVVSIQDEKPRDRRFLFSAVSIIIPWVEEELVALCCLFLYSECLVLHHKSSTYYRLHPFGFELA